jgi:urease accessory protein
MFVATSPYDAPTPTLPRCAGEGARIAPSLAGGGGGPGWGHLSLALERSDGATRLHRLYQKTPLRAFLPRHDSGDLVVAAIANVGGGLVGGDRASVTIDLGPGAAALVTTQAAEKVYRSLGPDCRIETRLGVGEGGWLEWCPQETILFDRARLRRSLELDLAPGARAMFGETLVLGRLASGERTRRGLLHDRIEIRERGLLRWRDVLRLAGDFADLVDAPAGLAGARAVTTFAYVAADAPERLDLARELLAAAPARTGATVVNDVLVARLLGEDPLALRGAFAQFWAHFRAAVAGLPPVLPRLWHV